ncbi:MAG: hypothetical protein IVW52_05135 [Acidimicrobiales bacterium]|nr:hypothetical protein [Acidimicrobiales bacterium]
MTDRITIRRLVNLGQYEHLSVEVSHEVPVEEPKETRDLVDRVERYARLYKRRVEIERELAQATRELEWARERVGLSEDAGRHDVEVRIDRFRHDLEETDGEWES